MNRRSGVRGFSLLELLIALTIMGFILALLFSGFSLASRSWDSAERHINENAQIQTSLGFIRRLISRAIPLYWRGTTGRPNAFSGTPTSIRFIAELPAHVSSGPRQIFLDVEEGEGKAQLVLRHLPLDREAQDFDNPSQAQPHVILTDARRISFAYFGQESTNTGVIPGTPPVWTAQWVNPAVRPAMIRLHVEFPLQTLDLLIAPMISQPNGCRWDDTSTLCLPA